MITKRLSKDRGHVDIGWLKSHHSFSFGNYYDPAYIHCRSLRVINEDVVAPDSGFPTHPHDNMEIVTYVLSGTLTHTDSMGHKSDINAGDIQMMRAGTGVTHSEWNYSKTTPVHLLQIWIIPDTKELPPTYDQIHLTSTEKTNQLKKVPLTIHQDVNLYASILEKNITLPFSFKEGRTLWIQLISGKIQLDDTLLEAGDAAKITGQNLVQFKGLDISSEFLVFDLD